MALAQLHGMATRMLDWTENPLLVLWFAVRTESKNDENGVVWLFNPVDADYVDTTKVLSPLDIRKTMVVVPAHANPRVRVQAGRFTVHLFQEIRNRFSPLEKLKSYKPRLKKIEIVSSAFSQIRCDLDRCGINSGSMFPDIGGLAAHVEWQHTKLQDE